jgi:L-rhamnose mutarotase
VAWFQVLPRHLTEATEKLQPAWPKSGQYLKRAVNCSAHLLLSKQLKYLLYSYNKIKHLKSENNVNYVCRFISTAEKTHAIPILTTLQMMCFVTYTDIIKELLPFWTLHVSRHTRKCNFIYFPKQYGFPCRVLYKNYKCSTDISRSIPNSNQKWIINMRSIHRNSFSDASAVWLTLRRHSRNSQSVNKTLWVCSGPAVTGLKEKHRNNWPNQLIVKRDATIYSLFIAADCSTCFG